MHIVIFIPLQTTDLYNACVKINTCQAESRACIFIQTHYRPESRFEGVNVDTYNIQTVIGKALNGDYSADLDETEAGPELRPLAAGINSMIRRLEEAEKNNKFRNALDMDNPVPMLIFDQDFNVLDANPAFLDLSGYRKERVLSMNAENFSVSEIEGGTFRETLSSGSHIHGKLLAELPKGARVIERHLIPFYDEGGHISRFFGVYLDVTAIEKERTRNCELEELSAYYESETERIRDSLRDIAAGKRDSIEPTPGDGGPSGASARETFLVINEEIMSLNQGLDLMIEDAGMLTQAAAEGRMKERADISRHRGACRDVMAEINQTLDAVSRPLDELMPVLKKLAVNDYTLRIKGKYQGDFNRIAKYLNRLIDQVTSIQGTALEIAAGDLHILNEFREFGKLSENDRMSPALIQMMEAIQALIDDAETLSRAVAEGRLDDKADPEKHQGGYREIMEGFSGALTEMQTPLDEAMRMAGHLSEGDYTVRFSESIRVNGDFVRFRDELNRIAISNSEAVTEIRKVALQVRTGTDEASRGSDEVAKAVEQVAINSQRNADLARSLLSEMEDISRQIAGFSASNEEIASTSEEVLKGANNVVDMGREAQKLGNEANERMEAVEAITEICVQEIEDLNDQMHDINNIVKVITEITNQINLLALNAAIEAARAGEHGRGFAVVAGEVKNLAAEAREATDQIDNVIAGVRKSSEKTAESIRSANAGVDEGAESVKRTITALNEIITAAGEAAAAVGEITKALEDQAGVVNSVVKDTEKGTELTKGVQSQVQELAALAEESSASTEEIGSALHEVNQLAENLKERMTEFRV